MSPKRLTGALGLCEACRHDNPASAKCHAGVERMACGGPTECAEFAERSTSDDPADLTPEQIVEGVADLSRQNIVAPTGYVRQAIEHLRARVEAAEKDAADWKEIAEGNAAEVDKARAELEAIGRALDGELAPNDPLLAHDAVAKVHELKRHDAIVLEECQGQTERAERAEADARQAHENYGAAQARAQDEYERAEAYGRQRDSWKRDRDEALRREQAAELQRDHAVAHAAKLETTAVRTRNIQLRAALSTFVDYVGNLRAPQNPADAALQVLKFAPLLEYAQKLLAEDP